MFPPPPVGAVNSAMAARTNPRRVVGTKQNINSGTIVIPSRTHPVETPPSPNLSAPRDRWALIAMAFGRRHNTVGVIATMNTNRRTPMIGR